MFGWAIWDKLPECIFENFEIAGVKQGQFQKFWKITRVTCLNQTCGYWLITPNQHFILKLVSFNSGLSQINKPPHKCLQLFVIWFLLLSYMTQKTSFQARIIKNALHDSVSFVQFKKHTKHPWRNVTLGMLQASACDFAKSDTPPRVFSHF